MLRFTTLCNPWSELFPNMGIIGLNELDNGHLLVFWSFLSLSTIFFRFFFIWCVKEKLVFLAYEQMKRMNQLVNIFASRQNSYGRLGHLEVGNLQLRRSIDLRWRIILSIDSVIQLNQLFDVWAFDFLPWLQHYRHEPTRTIFNFYYFNR